MAEPNYVHPHRIGFFFGAGASVEFGIPSMRKITSTFSAKINEEGAGEEEKNLFNTVYNSLEKVYGEGKVDLEAVMSVITGLRDNERLQENIGDLGLFILQTKQITDYVRQFKHDEETLDNLKVKFQQHIRKLVVIRGSNNIDHIRDVYGDFFKQICSISTCTNATSPELDPNKYTNDEWIFFTTNYDNAIEEFWVNGREHRQLSLGFEKENKIMRPNRFLCNNTDERDVTAMQLVKLHGSVNWIKNRNLEIREMGYHLSLEDMKPMSGSKDIESDIVIYPLSQKELYFTPFNQLFGILNADLGKRDLWIVIGYSFRDIIIRTMFERSLSDNKKRKIILVHPHATDQIKPLFQKKIQEQIKCMDMYFAKQDYKTVNKKIKEELAELARS